MQRFVALTVLIGMGIAVGCGSGKGPAVPEPPANKKDETPGGQQPSPVPNPERGNATQPQSNPNTSSGEVGVRVQPGGGEVFSTPEQIFAGIPADAHPSPAADGAIERVAAREWLKAKIVGKQLRWTATVTEVTANDGDKWTVEVHLVTNQREVACPGYVYYWRTLGAPVTLSNHRIEVCLRPYTSSDDPTIGYWKCTTAEARKLRALKGKTVTFESTIKSFSLSYYSSDFPVKERPAGAANYSDGYNAFVLELQCDPPSVDGWLPESRGLNVTPKK